MGQIQITVRTGPFPYVCVVICVSSMHHSNFVVGEHQRKHQRTKSINCFQGQKFESNDVQAKVSDHTTVKSLDLTNNYITELGEVAVRVASILYFDSLHTTILPDTIPIADRICPQNIRYSSINTL